MPARPTSEPAPVADRMRRAQALSVPRRIWRILAQTAGACFRYRVTGLAAEAAFFAILSLPPLVFAFAGAIGFVAQTFAVEQVVNFRAQVLALASRALTQQTVTSVIEPTLDDVLGGGRFSVISIGFVIALWSGSRALNVFVETISIMYGMAGQRGIVRARALAFGLYVVFLVAGVVLLPLVLAGPGFIDQLLPRRLEVVGNLYWPVVLLGSVCLLATLYHLSVPVRTRWRADLPGAALTLVIWLLGSTLLRIVLNRSVGSTSIYGPLAAPIALLIWLYLISIAVLIGAAFNAALDKVWPRLSGIPHDEAEQILAATTAPRDIGSSNSDSNSPGPSSPDPSSPDPSSPDPARDPSARTRASGDALLNRMPVKARTRRSRR